MAIQLLFRVTLVMAALLCFTAAQGPTTLAPLPAPLVATCPDYVTMRHTCNYQCDALTWRKTRYCHCDRLCVPHGDCCADYRATCGQQGGAIGEGPPVAPPRPMPDEFTECVQTVDLDPAGRRPRRGHYLVTVCPHDWSGDPAVRDLCRAGAGANDELAKIPVESPDGRHYRNVFCALCHGFPPESVSFWSVSFQERRQVGLLELDASQLLQNAGEGALFLKELNPPGFVSYNNYTAHLAASTLRACVLVDPLSQCRLRSSERDLCEQPLAPIAFDGTTYKNLACYQCHNATTLSDFDLERHCSYTNEYWESFVVSRRPSTFRLDIFSDHADVIGVGNGSGDSLGLHCEAGQIYDPFLDLCRDLVCPDGFALDGGLRCAAAYRDTAAGSTAWATVGVALTATGSLRSDFGARNAEEPWEAIATEAVGDYAGSVSVCSPGGRDGAESGEGDPAGGDCRGSPDLTWTCRTGGVVWNDEACGAGPAFTCSVNASFNAELPSVGVLVNQTNTISGKCFQGAVSNHAIRVDRLTISAPCGEQKNKSVDSDDGLNPPTTSSHVVYTYDGDTGGFLVPSNDSCTALDCSVLTLSPDEYEIAGSANGSIRLLRDDRVLRRGRFRLKENGDAEVCNSQQGVASGSAGELWARARFVLAVSGGGLSLAGVVLAVATGLAIPHLRQSATGKALLCLLMTLALAQLTMVIGLERTDDFALCVTFAIGAHYFWLSSFFWTNVLAIEIYRAFSIGGAQADDASTAASVCKYALYCLGAPAVIVGACVALSLCDCIDVDVRYAGEQACWIGDAVTNLVAFGVPVVAILFSNVVLVSLTVAGLAKTRRPSEKTNATAQNQNQGDDSSAETRADLILYLKLTAIMGCTWICAFLASFGGVQYFWDPFVVLNSLQGALCGLAVACDRRALTTWRAKLIGGVGGQQPGTGDCSSVERPLETKDTPLSTMGTSDVRVEVGDAEN